MKKQHLYIILIAVFTVTVGFVVMKYKTVQSADEQAIYPLLPRKGNTNNSEWKFSNDNYTKLAAKIKANPADHKSAIALVNTYILEGRAGGNIAYYDKAAMSVVEKILKKDIVEVIWINSMILRLMKYGV